MANGSWYDTAQICLNGHEINTMARKYPAHDEAFCHTCGAETITDCPDCMASIRGEYHIDGCFGGSLYVVPSFCYKCGKAYPWTESRLKAARDLVDESENLTQQERDSLNQSIDDLVKDTPAVPVAALRFKGLASKLGRAFAGGLKEILIGIVSETVKKQLWP